MDFLSLLSEETPDLVRHCVASYMKNNPGSDTSQAFAICVSTMQKAGYVQPGSMKLTAAGKGKEKSHETEPDAAAKMARYEKFLKAAREEVEQQELLAQQAKEPVKQQESQETPLTLLEEGLMSQIWANIKGRFQAYQDKKEIQVQLNKLHTSLESIQNIIDKIQKLSAKQGIPMLLSLQNTPYGFELTVTRKTRSATPPPAYPEPVSEAVLNEQLGGPGRPPLPVGSVRFWKKEGQHHAMVKIAEPDVWVYKKNKASDAPSLRGRKAPLGAVRAWKRRKVVKTGQGWRAHKAKYSQELPVQPLQPVQESTAPKRDQLRARLREASDSRAIQQESDKRTTIKQRLLQKSGENRG